MYKILLCCVSGVTTNKLVNAVKESAKQKDIKDEFMSCQAIEDVKDVCFSTSDSYLKIMIYGK